MISRRRSVLDWKTSRRCALSQKAHFCGSDIGFVRFKAKSSASTAALASSFVSITRLWTGLVTLRYHAVLLPRSDNREAHTAKTVGEPAGRARVQRSQWLSSSNIPKAGRAHTRVASSGQPLAESRRGFLPREREGQVGASRRVLAHSSSRRSAGDDSSRPCDRLMGKPSRDG